ncbi:unnamed protein product [Lupinus luteus]|uniref:Uncharacterized protein n=1 Tax=Lupinus luteus TaxID=3873 RepID=A0AAV1WPX3_LUPLU
MEANDLRPITRERDQEGHTCNPSLTSLLSVVIYNSSKEGLFEETVSVIGTRGKELIFQMHKKAYEKFQWRENNDTKKSRLLPVFMLQTITDNGNEDANSNNPFQIGIVDEQQPITIDFNNSAKFNKRGSSHYVQEWWTWRKGPTKKMHFRYQRLAMGELLQHLAL